VSIDIDSRSTNINPASTNIDPRFTFAGQRPFHWGFAMKWVLAGARSEPIKATIPGKRHISRNGTIIGNQGSDASPENPYFS
jgi:hypothetical protein